MADAARRETDKRLTRMERHLSRIYNRAQKEIGESWKEYMAEAAAELKPYQDAYEAAKRSGDEAAIKRTGRALGRRQRQVTLMNQHYKNMTEQAARDLADVNARAAAYVNDQLPGIYEVNYNFTAKQIEVQTNHAISYELVNERAVKLLAESDGESFLPHYTLDPKVDIPWNVRAINSEVLQGIIQGESIDKMAKRLEKVGVRNAGSSVRTARTMVTTVENQARHDSAKAAANKGVIMKKEWIATDDNRTRDDHMDAWDRYGTRETAILEDDYFRVGKDKMLYAGDRRHGSAENLYNCRCSTTYFADGFTSILPPEKRGKIKVRFTD